MSNPLDGLCVYDMAEHVEAESVRKQLAAVCTVHRGLSTRSQIRIQMDHKGNVKRVLKAGFKVYKPSSGEALYLVTKPDHVLESHLFTPVILENNNVVGA